MADKAEILRKEYLIRFRDIEKYRNGVWKILCDGYFSKYIAPDDHVLDLGSGWGEFINNISAGKKYAMDLNPDAGRHLTGKIEFLHQDCSETWQLPAGTLDVVFTAILLNIFRIKRMWNRPSGRPIAV